MIDNLTKTDTNNEENCYLTSAKLEVNRNREMMNEHISALDTNVDILFKIINKIPFISDRRFTDVVKRLNLIKDKLPYNSIFSRLFNLSEIDDYKLQYIYLCLALYIPNMAFCSSKKIDYVSLYRINSSYLNSKIRSNIRSFHLPLAIDTWDIAAASYLLQTLNDFFDLDLSQIKFKLSLICGVSGKLDIIILLLFSLISPLFHYVTQTTIKLWEESLDSLIDKYMIRSNDMSGLSHYLSVIKSVDTSASKLNNLTYQSVQLYELKMSAYEFFDDLTLSQLNIHKSWFIDKIKSINPSIPLIDVLLLYCRMKDQFTKSYKVRS